MEKYTESILLSVITILLNKQQILKSIQLQHWKNPFQDAIVNNIQMSLLVA